MIRKHYEPHPYQREAIKFLLNTPRAALFAGMGLGKSSVVLSVLDALKIAGSSFFPALVIAPLRVARRVWPREVAKWDAFEGMTIRSITGTAGERLAAMKAKRADIYTINYDNIPWLIKTLGNTEWPFKIVIADECTKLKNFRLMGHGGARANDLSYIVKHTGRWINLTGTPATNGLKDLWGPMWFLDQGVRLKRSYTAFMNEWFRENKYTKQIEVMPGCDKLIHEAIADLTLALRTEDCLGNIEEPQVTNVEVELPRAARAAYRAMEDEFFTELGGGIEAMNAGVKAMKLVQMASGAVYDNEKQAHEVHNAKLDGLDSIIEETGESLLVAYHFKFDAARIKKRFPHARVLESEKDMDDWNAGKIQLGLIHPQSAGHGIDLQDGGRNLVHFTHTWDLELRQQVLERIGPARQAQAGHPRAVMIYNIVAADTIDEVILERVKTKTSIQEALMIARSRRN